MKRLLSVLCLGVLVLVSGCARHYVITLSNGSQISTRSEPRLKRGAYVYRDARGQMASTPAGRVIEVAPASMSRASGSPVNGPD